MVRLFPPTEPDPGRLGDYTAECVVISAAIFAGPSTKRAELLAAVEPEHFYDPVHRSIWKAIRILVARDDGTATTFIAEETVNSDLRPTVDAPYLGKLIDDAKTVMREHWWPEHPKLTQLQEVHDYVFNSARQIRSLADQGSSTP